MAYFTAREFANLANKDTKVTMMFTDSKFPDQ